MSNISGGSSNDGEFDEVIADRSITLRSKYTLPLDTPPATNYFIKSDGTSQLEWADAAAAELGNVNFSGVSVISGNMASFSGTTGTEIIDSGIASSNLLTNPLAQNLNLDGNSIINIDENIYTAKASGITPAVGELTIYASNVDNEFHQIDENGIDTVLGGETFDQSLNTTDAVEFLSVATDTITEQTPSAGVTVEGTLMKDGNTTTGDVIMTDSNEYKYTFNNGNASLSFSKNTASGVGFRINRARGALAGASALINDDYITQSPYYGHDGTSYRQGVGFDVKCVGNWDATNRATKIIYSTVDSGTTALMEKIVISDDIDITNAELNITDSATYSHNFMTDQQRHWRHGDFTSGTTNNILRSRGSATVPTALLSGDTIGVQFFQGHNSSQYNVGATVTVKATENWASGNEGTSWTLQTIDVGDNVEKDKIVVGDAVTISNATLNTDLIYMTNGTSYRNDMNDGYTYKVRAGNFSGGVAINDFRSRGDLTTPTALLINDLIAVYTANGHDGSAYSQGVRIKSQCTENWGASKGTAYIIQTRDIGSPAVVDKLSISDDIRISNSKLIIGGTGNDFSLPNTRASTTNQVLKDVLGDGVVTWETETASSETLQEAFDAGQQILTSVGNGTLVIKQGVGASDNLFEIKDSSDTLTLTIQKNGSILLDNSVISGATVQGLDLKATGTLAVGSGAGSYQLPPNRTTANEGDILVLNDTSGILEFQKPLNLYDFIQNFTTSNISGTTGEIDMTSATGIGSLVIPANTLVAGSTWHVKCSGTFENATVSDELRIRFYLGTVAVIDTGIIDLPKIAALEPWIFEADLTFRTVGATATSVFNAQFTFNDAGSYLGSNVVGSSATVDTSSSQTWKGTSQWSNASVTNKFYTQILYFRRIS